MKRQRRRSISVRPEVYERLRAYTRDSGDSMSALVEDVVTRFLDAEDVPTVSREEAIARQGTRPPGRPKRELDEDEIEELRRRAFGG